MWVPVVVMIAGFQLYFIALLLMRIRGEILRRESNAYWVAQELGEAPLDPAQPGPPMAPPSPPAYGAAGPAAQRI